MKGQVKTDDIPVINKDMKKKELKKLNSVIQVCDCGKVDAYKDDGHDCGVYLARNEDEGSYADHLEEIKRD